jgi:dethiobiotin synthetase
MLAELLRRGVSVAVRKPAQSFDVDSEGRDLGGPTDAERLGEASGEDPDAVCHPFRSYRRAMAPPMAAEALGLPSFTVADLVEELAWPADRADVGVVELAGGIRSPQAADGDSTDLVAALRPDIIVLVADAGLGTINSVRLSMEALSTVVGAPPSIPIVVVLDRFDGHHELHRRNREWLSDRYGFDVVTMPGADSVLADLARWADWRNDRQPA